MKRLIGVAACGLGVAACAVGPDFHRPAAPAVTVYGGESAGETASASTLLGEAQHFASGVPIPQQWWQRFQSKELDSLVQQALQHSPDLQAAEAALRLASENTAAQRGAYLPTVGAGWSSTRQQDATGTLSPTLSSGASIYALHTAQVQVSYVPDLFGANRRTVESLLATERAQSYQVRATYLSLVANVVVAVIAESSLQAQVQATQQMVDRERSSLRLLQRQYDLGAVSQSQVSAQQAALAQAEASLPSLQQQRVAQHDLLAQLTGRLPSQLPDQPLDLATLTLPSELPISVPSALVDRRPDVLAAEEQLHAATAQVGVAVASMLPEISLTADAGTTAVSLARLMQPGTRFWSLGASLSQTLFAGGSLVHRKRAAVAAMDQSAALYRSTVLISFRQVADALAAVTSDAQALEAQSRAEAAATETLNLTQTNVKLGASTGLDLLDAERVELQAVVGLQQARAARLTDTVALFQALGGGDWQSSP